MTIILNAQPVETSAEELSYEDIMKLAGQENVEGGPVFTITYRRGQPDQKEGSLTPGQKVKTKQGMFINCLVTGAA